MGRYIGPKNKIARRFGIHLGLKTNPTKVARRLQQPPGVHGQRRRPTRRSSFGEQLLEKQKAKFLYGIREEQFRRYVREATRRTGDSGIMLRQTLEFRLDNVVYRMGFAGTRAQARQFVNHGMFDVNKKKMDIPSYVVRIGDVVTLRETKKKKKIFVSVGEQLRRHTPPSWIALDPEKQEGKILHAPKDEDMEKIFDVKPIIEYYSSR